MAPAPSIDYRRDPLGALDHHLLTGDETFWVTPSMVCVSEPTAAKWVLANPDCRFREHSDFFHTRGGPFGPRSLQLALGRGARALLTEHVRERSAALPETIERELGTESDWPNAGNFLIYRHLASVLVAPERREAIGATVDQVVELAVLAGVRESRSRWRRALFRLRVFRALTREIEQRRRELVPGEARAPRDLFDVLVSAAGPEVLAEDLGELYLPFLFAVVGSVGFTLGWSVYLLGTHRAEDVEPGWIVREALRLWPIAWNLVRYPAESQDLAGVEVTPEHQVLVSPYVTQRHPAYWKEPGRFRPERWAETPNPPAFLPFGWGPHTCAAASLTLELVAQVLAVLLRSHRLEVSPRSDRPFTGPSLAPPRFRLAVAPRAS